MAATIKDPLLTIVSLLTDNWNSANTNSRTPTVDEIFDRPNVIDLRDTADFVLVYEQRTKIIPFIGKSDRGIQQPVSIDIRTTFSRSHAVKMLGEVDRILNTKIVEPDANYDILIPDDGWIDLSDKWKKMFRYVYDVTLWVTGETRPS